MLQDMHTHLEAPAAPQAADPRHRSRQRSWRRPSRGVQNQNASKQDQSFPRGWRGWRERWKVVRGLHPPAQTSSKDHDLRDIFCPGLSAWEKYVVIVYSKLQKKILEKKGKRTERKRATRAANKEEARGRAVKAATRAKRVSKEIVVTTWNTRTMAEKGSNGIGHAETLLRRARRAGCDIVGLQETWRSGQTSF